MKLRLTLSALFLINCSAQAPGGETSPDPETGAASGGASTSSGGSVDAPAAGGSTAASGGSDMGVGATGGSDTGGGASDGALCSGPAILACDDFETQTEGSDELSGPWEVLLDPYSATDSTVTVSSERAHSGNLSIKVDARGGYTNRALVAVPGIFPVPNNRFFARFWAYFETEFGTINDGQHMSYAFATGPFEIGTPGDEVRAGVHGNILNINFRGGPTLGDPSLKAYTDDGKNQEGIEPLVGEWVCTEIEFDGESDIINFWRNEELISELHTDPDDAFSQMLLPQPTWSPEYADFRFGWQSYGGRTMTAYYDDVVISSERIGCDGP